MRAFGVWGVPFQGYCPDSSLCRPQRAREKVVLPAPLRPQSRTNCPSGMVRTMLFRQPSGLSG